MNCPTFAGSPCHRTPSTLHDTYLLRNRHRLGILAKCDLATSRRRASPSSSISWCCGSLSHKPCGSKCKEQRQDARSQSHAGLDRLLSATASSPDVYRSKLSATEPQAPAYRPNVACERFSHHPVARGRVRLGCRGYPKRVVEPSIQSPLWRPAFVPLSAVALPRDCRLAALFMQRSPWRPDVLVLSRLCRPTPTLHG